MGQVLQRGFSPKEQRRAVVIGDYPELGSYDPGHENMGLLDAAVLSLCNEFPGSVLLDYSE